MTGEPPNRATTDQASSDPAPPPTTRPDRVTAGEIVELLHHLTRFHASTPGRDAGGDRGGDTLDRAAVLAHKAELFTRIAAQRARTAPTAAPPTPSPTPEGPTP